MSEETGESQPEEIDAVAIETPVPAGMVEEEEQHATPAAPLVTLGLGSLIWITAGLVFALMRLGPIWQAAVGGAELLHLAGSWQASVGLHDDRFVPTLFQAITALLFHASDSEIPARIIAYGATLTIPCAIYRLRKTIGEPAALLALIVLAFEPLSIDVGSSASAMGFDLAISAWLFVLLAEGKTPRPGVVAAAAFLVTTSGPVVLPLVLAALLVAMFRHLKTPVATIRECAIGVVVGVAVTSVAYGVGPVTLRIAPFDLFAASFDQPWATPATWQVLALYSGSLVIGAAVAGVVYVRRFSLGIATGPWLILVVGWTAAAAAWVAVGSQAHTVAAAAALTLPAAILVGIALNEALPAMLRADWSRARFLLPAALLAGLIATNFVIDWARMDRVGDFREESIVTLLCLVAVAAIAAVAMDRRGRPTLLAVALSVAMLPTLSGAFGIGLSSVDEPVPSPRATAQGRQLRDIALDTIARQGGIISIHPRIEAAATWPFRDSGDVEIASTPGAEATFVLWPAGLEPPAGFVPLEGTWALTESVRPPTRDFLRYLRWVTDRNTLVITPAGVNVYLKASQ